MQTINQKISDLSYILNEKRENALDREDYDMADAIDNAQDYIRIAQGKPSERITVTVTSGLQYFNYTNELLRGMK